jgi:multidrug efflux system membrane fusion protein
MQHVCSHEPRRFTAGRRHVIRAVLLALLATPGLALAPAAVAQTKAESSSPAVPVTAASVTRQDVPLWLSGLGAVRAFNAVQLRSQVDGILQQVAVAEGQEVKKGELLAVIDPRPYQAALDAAKAKKQEDLAHLTFARQDLARYAALAKDDFASRQQLQTAQAQTGQYTAAVAADDAQIEAAQLNLGYCYIRSPIDGRVGFRLLDAGNVVRAAEATPILSVTQIRPVSVTFTLPQDQLTAVNEARAEAKLPVAVFASEGGKELDRGYLETVDNAIDQATGTIRLKATLPNTAGKLWPGQFVTAQLLLRTDKNVVAVPTQAVQHSPSGLYVYVVKPDSTVARQDIDAARQAGALTVVAKGLTEGQTVVTDGQSRLQPGMRVAVSEGKQASRPAKIGG